MAADQNLDNVVNGKDKDQKNVTSVDVEVHPPRKHKVHQPGRTGKIMGKIRRKSGEKGGKRGVPMLTEDQISLQSSKSEEEEDDLGADGDAAGDWDVHRDKRETWTGKLDFILSCIGYAVGLGNVWRFPYLCYRSGGGAFLVPYFIFLILCGMPLIMLEMCIGQFAGLSPTALFQKFCPLFQGLGWGMVIVSGIVCVYYNVIITWTLYYLYLSLRATLPWVSCTNWWNTGHCVTGIADLMNNQTSVPSNESSILEVVGRNVNVTRTASEEFWRYYVLQLSPGLEDMGGIRLELLLSLLVAWVLIFCCLFKGVKSSGRVVYVTATFPYLVLVILLIRGLTLPGALEGIKFYLVPDWSKLKELSVWQDAASQIFYSVGAAWGALITMASYNRFRHNCYRDAIIIPLINCGTSVFAGIVVFSIIGFMAHESGKPVSEVITSGPGLVFIVYPEAVSKLPISPMWSVLFFCMILTIGVDSQFGMFETLISALVDSYPEQLRKRKVMFTGLVCVTMFFMGIPCIMQGGMYVLQLMDWYSATFSLMFITFCECIIVAYIYGYKRFMLDIQLMTRRTVFAYFPIAWCFITPLVVLCLLILGIVNHKPVSYDNYDYPPAAIAAGWIIACISIIPTPIFAIWNMCKAKGTLRERLAECLRPRPDWGPSRLGDRVAFRKSFAQLPTKQTYVLGVERQEEEMKYIAATHPSCADFSKFIEEVHEPLDPT